MNPTSTRHLIGLIMTIALALGATAALACEDRQVVVNNAPLDCQTLAAFDQVTGERLENGAYWLDDLGYWGYAGYPTVMGQIDIDSLHQRLGRAVSAAQASWEDFHDEDHLFPLGS